MHYHIPASSLANVPASSLLSCLILPLSVHRGSQGSTLRSSCLWEQFSFVGSSTSFHNLTGYSQCVKSWFCPMTISFLFRTVPLADGSSQARGQIGPPCHGNAGSEPHLQLHHSSWQHWIQTQWSRPGIEATSLWVLVEFLTRWATVGTPTKFFKRRKLINFYFFIAYIQILFQIFTCSSIHLTKPILYLSNQTKYFTWISNYLLFKSIIISFN